MGFWWWLLKSLATMALTAPVLWIGTWKIADYISEKHVRGLTVSIQGLDSSLTRLDNTVTAINTGLSRQLVELERDRADLAISIAKEVAKLDGGQRMQAQDISFLRDSIGRIEKTLVEIRSTTEIRYTIDGGKTIELLGTTEDALQKLGLPAGEPYVIAPWSVQEFDALKATDPIQPKQ